MKLLAFLLLAILAGLYARHLLDRDGLLEPVDELAFDSALSASLPDYRREVH